MSRKYGPDIGYDTVEIGHLFQPYQMKLGLDIVDAYKKAFTISDEDLWGILFLHRFLYESIGGQFPDGNLHASLRVRMESHPQAGEAYRIQAKVVDKFIKKHWKYLVIEAAWADTSGNEIATVSVTHAVEREEANG